MRGDDDRGNIRLDEMRMSFGRDKYQVYENIVNLKLTNLANTSCGTASAYLIRPNRKSIWGASFPAARTYASVNTVEPGGILAYTPGRWRVLVHYETGCNKYRIDVNW